MYKLNKNSNSRRPRELDLNITPIELRLQKDLLELKKFRMTTKMFNTQFSHMIKDNEQNNFKMFVSMEMISNKIKYNFCLIFPKEYPFSPPMIKNVNLNSGNFACNPNSITTENNYLSKLVLKENWSPILSINTILFALELMLIDPSQEENISPLNLFERERKLIIDSQSMLVDDIPEFTHSPKIISPPLLAQSNSYNSFYSRKKRLNSELSLMSKTEFSNPFFQEKAMPMVFKKYKYTGENITLSGSSINIFDIKDLEENFKRII